MADQVQIRSRTRFVGQGHHWSDATSGGINTYPREIEEVLQKHPTLVEAAVVGVQDDYFGETLRAFVVIRPQMNVRADELESHCRSSLAGYKVPKEFRFVPRLPRNAGGKVLKKELRGLAPAG